ncbi:hypothetical protein DL240_00120 [Lujinxingia litoralis]|uniref:Uncharacterized protein n=1 Tax=Lujinxingia litoralis TaxID=2211119 RepID=A0A328CAU7_9DELT|nr:hypothetical protein DL240_00120 [Lujinxingia litoralis]
MVGVRRCPEAGLIRGSDDVTFGEPAESEVLATHRGIGERGLPAQLAVEVYPEQCLCAGDDQLVVGQRHERADRIELGEHRGLRIVRMRSREQHVGGLTAIVALKDQDARKFDRRPSQSHGETVVGEHRGGFDSGRSLGNPQREGPRVTSFDGVVEMDSPHGVVAHQEFSRAVGGQVGCYGESRGGGPVARAGQRFDLVALGVKS